MTKEQLADLERIKAGITLRRRRRIRIDADEHWITTESGNHVMVNEEGAPVAGNKHVVEAMNKGRTRRATNNIKYSDKMSSEKWQKSKMLINGLANEFNTKLQEVRPGANKGAGNVQVSGSVMNLSSASPEVALHEFAHTISMEEQTKFGLHDESDFWKEIKRVQRAYKKAVENKPNMWISSYEHSNRSANEFMAEAFTQAYMKEKGWDLPSKYGKDDTYSKQVLDIVRKYYGKQK